MRIFLLFVQTDSPARGDSAGIVEAEVSQGVRRTVLTLFDISKHHRGSGTVDKIKKYRRDSPSGVFTDLGRRDLPQSMASVNPDGRSW